ncbi:protein IQ-DOMAIN 1 isoform X1 [Abrus precatorius]|uniref:Protein IQ-DOMAIN 1 isoform X1 n=1 Tax=Abrus precatorius TaxID=3816 RepID=A0A8B8MFD1_ABRPR|nr:protein IQ-DOMAIN 1 isoform X1 [Abrus precatorius]
MGRKGGWFSAVKRIFSSDSKKDQKPHHHKSKIACFGHHHPEDLERETEGVAIVAPSLPPRKDKKPRSEAENEQSKQAFSLVLATAVAAGAAVAAAQAAAEVARLTSVPRYPGKTDEEVAAIKIQKTYRGHLARRKLRGLRGLARLKTLVQGQSVQRQAATTLQCMQTLSRLQAQVRARRIKMSEQNQALQRQMQQKREKELQNAAGEKWDDSSHSKEQIEAKLLNRQVAAMRRERALAYASTHQQTWKNTSKPSNATFMDPNNPHWGWNWLERWMAARPWEGQNTMYHNGHAPTKSAAKHTMSVSEITKLYSLRDQNHDVKNSPTSQKASRPRSHISPSTLSSKASSTNGTKEKADSSPKGGSWGGDDDPKSMFSKVSENNRRHSIAVPVKDNESLASSSPALTTHTNTPPPTKVVTKAKSKVRSLSSGVHRNGTPEKESNIPSKKRLSFSASPAASRRHSVPPKVGNLGSNKNVGTIPEEKMKMKNGGSR